VLRRNRSPGNESSSNINNDNIINNIIEIEELESDAEDLTGQIPTAVAPEPQRPPQPSSPRLPDEEDEIEDDDEKEDRDASGRKITKPGDPAYVAPIPKIGPIPLISHPGPLTSPSSQGADGPTQLPGSIQVSANTRPTLPPFVGSFLKGKTVDEYGDIVDDKTGQVLARAGGDLPSIIGRKVSNNQGDILGDDGELLGYVADIEIERKSSESGIAGGGSSSQSPPIASPSMPRSLFDLMGRSSSSLLVDHLGNILDPEGNVVGKFLDNNNPLHRKEKEEREAREKFEEQQKQRQQQRQQKRRSPPTASSDPCPPPPPPPPPQQEQQQERQEPSADQGQQSRPRRTEEERRQNAEAWRKENPGESPSDIFLDVKSTTEGIQLTIRIPTVFGNGQQVRPNISFS